MSGFIFGAACLSLLVLFGVRRAFHHRFHRHHGGGCHRGGCHGRRHGRRAGVGRAMGEILKRRLDVDDEQEPIVDHALADLRKAVDELAAELRETRGPVADAFRGEAVDDAALAAAFARHDDALQRARRQVVSALKQVHAVLEPEQRAKAADWLADKDARWL